MPYGDPIHITHLIRLASPFGEEIIISKEPPRNRRGEPASKPAWLGIVDGVMTVYHGSFGEEAEARAYVDRRWKVPLCGWSDRHYPPYRVVLPVIGYQRQEG
jgi:hypothetical protein